MTSRAGNDSLHGGHQLAQKSTSATLPFASLIRTAVPPASRHSTAGAGVRLVAATTLPAIRATAAAMISRRIFSSFSLQFSTRLRAVVIDQPAEQQRGRRLRVSAEVP